MAASKDMEIQLKNIDFSTLTMPDNVVKTTCFEDV